MKQEIIIGYGKIDNLKDILTRYSPKNIFLVTGKKSYFKSGAKKILDTILKDYNVTRFYDFEVNPKIKDIKKGISICREKNCDLIIGVGGGSVLDVAKTISILSKQKLDPEKYIKKETELNKVKIPFVAIPTTFGTGSESTHFSVVYINKTKYSLADDIMLPDIAVINPKFALSLSRTLKACTVLDALSQAIEAMWSVNSNGESIEYSKKALKYLVPYIDLFVNNDSPEKEICEKIALGSNFAGRAINIAKTTASHSVSYPITSYFNQPHGQAVALTLPEFLNFNMGVTKEDIQDKRGIDHVKKIILEIIKLFDAKNAEECSLKLRSLMKSVGLATSLSELNIDNEIGFIVENGFNPERMKNNPRIVSKEDLREILNKIK